MAPYPAIEPAHATAANLLIIPTLITRFAEFKTQLFINTANYTETCGAIILINT
jgi:hypothetical protein